MQEPKSTRSKIRRLLLTALSLQLAATAAHAEWEQTITAEWPATPKVNSLAALGGDIFAGFESGAFRSSNHGATWTQINNGIPAGTMVFSLAVSGDVLFAGTVDQGVFRSADHGSSWARSGLPGAYVTVLAAQGQYLFAATCCDGIYRSADQGVTWTKTGLVGSYIGSMAVNGGALFAGTSTGLRRSTDHGATWTPADSGMPHVFISGMSMAGMDFFVGTSAGLFRSSDHGVSWVPTGLNTSIQSLAGDDAGLFVGTSQGMLRSLDHGASWKAINTGLLETTAYCLMINGADLFAGVPGDGIWRRPLSEMESSASVRPGAGARAPLEWRAPRGLSAYDLNGRFQVLRR
jgi:hypothetical protein